MFHRRSRGDKGKSLVGRTFKPRLEALDRRDLPAVAYSFVDTDANTVLTGTTLTDTFAVSKNLSNNVEINGVDTGVSSVSILFLTMQGDASGAANDTFDLSKFHGADFPNLMFVDLDGGAGGNSLLLNDDAHTVFILGNDGTGGSAVFGSSYSLFIANTASVAGGAGDDQFVFADGAGLSGAADGKGGINSLGFDSYTTGVSVDMAGASATNMGSIANFHNVSGGAGDDLLVGSAGDNLLNGNAGNDTIDTGNGGIDFLDGFAGDNLFIIRPTVGADISVFGGPDHDTISFTNSTSAVTINLDTSVDQAVVAGTTLRFLIPGEVESLVGSPFADDITVQPGFGHARFIDGGQPVLPTLPGDVLHLDLLGAFPAPDNSALTLNPPGGGVYSSDNLNSVTFTSIESFLPNAPISNITVNASATVRDFRIVRNGADEEIRDITGGTVPGTLLYAAPYASLTSLTINGTTAFPNRVVLDFGGSGAPIPGPNANPIPGSFAFNGRGVNDGPAVSGDEFDVAGGGPTAVSFSDVNVTFTSANSGSATFVDTTFAALGAASFSNVDAVNLSGGGPAFFANTTAIDSLTLALPAGATDSTFEDDGVAADGVSRIRSTAAIQIPATSFPNPNTLLRVDSTAAGAQTVRLSGMDAGFAPVRDDFNGDASDVFQLTSNNFLRVPTSGVTLTSAKFDMNGINDVVTWFEGTGELALTAGATLAAGDASNRTFAGAITGTGGLNKVGSGTWTLSGAVNNTYSGVTSVNNGTLELKKNPGFQAVGGNLQIGGNAGANDSSVVMLTGAGEQIVNTSTVTIFVTGALRLNGFNETIGPLNARAGSTFGATVDGGGGIFTLGGTVLTAQTGTGGGGVDIRNGTLNLGTAGLVSGRRRFSVIDGATPNDLYVDMTVTGSAGLLKDGPGQMELAAVGNNYVGSTSLMGGLLRVSGSLAGAGAGAVSLDAANVIFEGGAAGVRSVVGRGVVVTAKNTVVRSFNLITNSGSGSGIRLNPGSSATIRLIGNSAADGLRGNHTAIDVNGGTARIESNYIGHDGSVPNASDGFSFPGGIRVRGGGVVDAGQPGPFDFTGLGPSVGGNNFANFDTGGAPVTGSATPPSYRQALLNLNTNGVNTLTGPQGVPTDMMAQANTFDGVLITGSYTVVERQVYHDVDHGTRGFVNYVNPASPSATLVDGPRFYSVTPTAAANNNWNQRSMIRRARVSYDNFVYLNLSSGGVTLNRIASAEVDAQVGRTPGPVMLNQPSSNFDYLTGRFNYDMGFSTYSVEISGSLMDGKYSMNFTGGVRTLHPTLGISATPPSVNPVVFHRLFGDANGDGLTTNSDFSAFLAAFNTTSASPNYREYFNFDNDFDVDSADRQQFLSRLNLYTQPI